MTLKKTDMFSLYVIPEIHTKKQGGKREMIKSQSIHSTLNEIVRTPENIT